MRNTGCILVRPSRTDTDPNAAPRILRDHNANQGIQTATPMVFKNVTEAQKYAADNGLADFVPMSFGTPRSLKSKLKSLVGAGA